MGGPPDSGGGRVIWWPIDLRFKSEDLKAEEPVIRSQNEPKRFHTYYSVEFFCINMYTLTDLNKCLDHSLTYQLVLVCRTKPFRVVIV